MLPIEGISGVPLSEEADCFLEVLSVCGVRRLKRYRDGEEEESESLLSEFVGSYRRGFC